MVRRVLDLREARGRKLLGLTVVDGVREMSLALAAGVEIVEAWGCPSLIKTKEAKSLWRTLADTVPNCLETTVGIMEKMSFGDRCDGVLVVIRTAAKRITDLNLPDAPLVVVLEHVEKPGNLGAVLRTCDAAGVHAVVVTDPATDLNNPNVIRASLGSVFTVPVVATTNEAAATFLRERQMAVIAARPQATDYYSEMDLKGPTAWVLGSEQKGLSPFWLKNSSAQVRIPMRGRVDSLNVATTAAVLIYETLRQRGRSS